jgi:hypothetical protein
MAPFLVSYVAARGIPSSQDDAQVAWAAGLWARLFDARKELTLGGGSSAERLRQHVAPRADRAGLRAGPELPTARKCMALTRRTW